MGGRKSQAILFGLVALLCAYAHQDPRGANQASRLALLHALVQHRTWQIDAYHHLTPDKAIWEHHYYSDKPPGTVLIALPAFLLSALLLRLAGVDLDSDTGWFLSSWITSAGSVGLVTALGAVSCWRWLSRWLAPKPALTATLAIFLGAAPFPYATTLFPHGAVVGLLLLALESLRFETIVAPPAIVPQNRRPHWCPSDLLAGCLCALALACDYTAGLVVIGLVVFLVRLSARRAAAFVLGAAGVGLVVPAYHWICFGTPFTLAYAHEAVFVPMHHGLCGIRFPPHPHQAWQMLWGARHGLFIWTPFLTLALPGLVCLYRRSRPHFWLAYLVPMLHWLLLAGYYDPEAGHTIGPRHLSATLPLLILPAALGLDRYPRAGLCLAIVSVAGTVLATFINIQLPPGTACPWLDFYLPALARGHCAWNLGACFGLNGSVSLVPPLVMLCAGAWCLRVGRSKPTVADTRTLS